MGVAQLSRVTVIAPRSDYQKVLTELAKFDEFHLVKDKAPSFDPATEELAVRAVRLFAQVDQAVRDLAIPLQPNTIEYVFRGAEVPQTSYDARDWDSLLARAEKEAEPIMTQVRNLQARLAQMEKDESDLNELVSTLETVSNISTDLGMATRLRRAKVFLSVVDKKILPELQSSLSDVVLLWQPVSETKVLLFIGCFAPEYSKVDKAVRLFELKALVLPPGLPQSPAEAYGKLAGDLKDVTGRREEAELELEKLKLEGQEKLLAVREVAQSANAVLDEVRTSGGLRRVATISGFIPKSREQEFQRQFGGWVVSAEAAHSEQGEALPTLITNVGAAKPFQAITLNQGLPGHAEVDPTPIITFVFPIFYGMMFGDLGHGIVATAFSILLLRAKKADIRTWGKIFLAAGISASFFGLIFGEFFGFDFAKLSGIPAVLEVVHRVGSEAKGLDPAAVYSLLTITLLIGIFHLILAMSLGIVRTVRERETVELLIEKIPSFVLYISGIFFALSFIGAGFSFKTILTSTNLIPLVRLETKTVGLISMTVAIASLVVLALGKGVATILHKWHGETVSEAFIGGVIEVLVKIAESLSNTISYARLAILLFVHAALLIATNKALVLPLPAAIPMLVVFNILIMLLEGLIVYIQDLRLHLYEFFTKFYEGTGSPFRRLLPERIRTKINWG